MSSSSISTIKITNGGTVQGYALAVQDGFRRRTVFAIPYDSDFDTFFAFTTGKQEYSTLRNDQHELHDNTEKGFLNWASTVLAAASLPAMLYAIDEELNYGWPSDPTVAADWETYKFFEVAGPSLGIVFRAAEARDDKWARRMDQYPGGKSQRVSTLFAMSSADSAGLPIPFWASPPDDDATDPWTYQVVVSSPTPDSTPSLEWVIDNKGPLGITTPLLTYSILTRWSQVILPPQRGVPQTVTMSVPFNAATPEWIESVPPFNGMDALKLTQLSFIVSGVNLDYRFGPSAPALVATAGQSTAVTIPSGSTLTIDDISRIQFLEDGAINAVVTISYILA